MNEDSFTTAQEEKQQLITEPLPPDDSDRAIPTRVHDIDQHLLYLQDQITMLNKEIMEHQVSRLFLLKRAKECHISEDALYQIIDTPVYDKKRVNVEVLKTTYTDKYERILENIKLRIQDKALADVAKAVNFISQADVKSVIREKGILAVVIPEQAIPVSWETVVVKK